MIGCGFVKYMVYFIRWEIFHKPLKIQYRISNVFSTIKGKMQLKGYETLQLPSISPAFEYILYGTLWNIIISFNTAHSLAAGKNESNTTTLGNLDSISWIVSSRNQLKVFSAAFLYRTNKKELRWKNISIKMEYKLTWTPVSSHSREAEGRSHCKWFSHPGKKWKRVRNMTKVLSLSNKRSFYPDGLFQILKQVRHDFPEEKKIRYREEAARISIKNVWNDVCALKALMRINTFLSFILLPPRIEWMFNGLEPCCLEATQCSMFGICMVDIEN